METEEVDQFEYILTVPVVKHWFFVLPVAIKCRLEHF